MTQGPVEAKIIEQATRLKMPLPDAIRNAPELDFGLELFFTAFSDLTTCRSSGMGEGPIPYSFIIDYCVMHGIEGEQRDDTVYFVRQLDNAYLEHRREESKKK